MTDTVLAPRPGLLTVEVRGANGRPAPGATVRFESLLPADTTRRTERGVYVCARGALPCADGSAGAEPFAAARTDSAGRASVVVRLGTVAGPTGIVLSVPEFGLRDTVRYTVLPGAAVRLHLAVRDTALFVGGTFSLDAMAVDRYGNRRPDSVAFEPAGGVVQVAPRTLRAVRIGRTRVDARAGAVRDSMFVSVVPEGTLAVYEPDRAAVLTFDLDGSRQVRWSTGVGSAFGAWPSWSPDGARIVFHGAEDTQRPKLQVTNAAGQPRQLMTSWAPSQFQARWARNGDWIYFNSLGSYAYQTGTLSRARPDGSAPEFLRATPPAGGDVNTFVVGQAPDPSPDGRRLVYTRHSYEDSDWNWLEVLDVASRTIRRLPVRGLFPRWSPDGTQVAYLDMRGTPTLIGADGTNARPLTTPDRTYYHPLDWSPDGRWLVIGTRDSGLELIGVETGEIVPLPYAAGRSWSQPAWRPVTRGSLARLPSLFADWIPAFAGMTSDDVMPAKAGI